MADIAYSSRTVILPNPLHRARLACLLAAWLAAPVGAAETSAACPAAADLGQAQMLGLWRAEFQGLWEGATLLIEAHARYAGSLSGAINRNGEKAQLAGDLDKGELTLEESADGVRIAATWLGDVVEGSCGREIRGTWQAAGESAARGFVLRKQ